MSRGYDFKENGYTEYLQSDMRLDTVSIECHGSKSSLKSLE